MVRITDKQLDMALRMASQYCYEDDIAMMKAIDMKDYPMTEKIRKRFNRMIRKSERRERREILNIAIPNPIKKVAIIVLVIGTLLFTGMMTIQPVRAAIVDVIIRWYELYIGVLFTVEQDEPTEIENIVLPRNLTPEWEVKQLISEVMAVEHILVTPDGERLRLSQIVIGQEEQWIDNEDVSIKKVHISEKIDGMLYSYPDRLTLIWKDKYAFILRGQTMSEDKLIQIAINMISP